MPLALTDLHALATILRDGAKREILPRFRHLAPSAVREKSGPFDLVTDADEAAEAWITGAIEQAFPGALVVGEEAATHDPSLIARLATADLAVTLDPIDGTANFAAGLPLFGVMAAVVEQGETTAAIILDPIVDSYSAALRGEGAMEYGPDGTAAPLRAAPPVPVEHMAGMVSWRFMPPPRRERVLAALPRLANLWDHRCAAHEYRALVAGHAHFVVFNKLLPWDHLPGALLAAEAGAHVAKFDASHYRPGEIDGGLICAPDLASWLALRSALLGG